jgi:SUMO ligase MMS21 Smc5/6 complex component
MRESMQLSITHLLVTQKPNKKTQVPQTEESVSDFMMNLRRTLLIPGSVLAKVATSSVASTTSG